MEQPNSIIKLQTHYLQNFVIVYDELMERICTNKEITKEELSSYIEELCDYAVRGQLDSEVIGKLTVLRKQFCN